MGRAFGTGSPIFFHCPVARRNRSFDGDLPRGHTIKLTGRTKPFKPNGALGTRSSFTSREYECSCGHVGWSAHKDLERMERKQPRESQ